MKHYISLILVVLTSVILSSCSKSTNSEIIEFSEYDFTNITICMGALLDEDIETVCTEEDSNLYFTDYANHFIQYLDSQAEVIVSLSVFEETQYSGDMWIMIRYGNLPDSMGEDSLSVFNQILQEVSHQLQSIIINDLDMIKIIRPEMSFEGQRVVGLFENYDVASFQYLARNGTSEIYKIDLRYYGDMTLTDEYDTYLDRLDTISETSVANSFRVYRSNGVEYVSTTINPSGNEYEIVVDGEGMGTTDLTNDDFLNIVETHYPDYNQMTD